MFKALPGFSPIEQDLVSGDVLYACAVCGDKHRDKRDAPEVPLCSCLNRPLNTTSPKFGSWQKIDTTTSAMEVAGLGVIVRSIYSGAALVFVPGARISNGAVIREDRANPLNNGFKPPTPEQVAASREGMDDDEFDEGLMLP